MIKISTILLFAFFSIHSDMNVSNGDKWDNPEINCGMSLAGTPKKQFPYHQKFKASNDDLLSFCNEMKETFATSNLTIAEAELIYAQLFENKVYKTTKNAGLASTENTPHNITLEEYQVKTAVKKVENNTVLVYFHWDGCGTNYEYYQCKYKDSKISEVERIEAWATVVPCD